jgi:NAD(P)-dependent dehydrogenase (short-subunit alcohol dehydrogenase family)
MQSSVLITGSSSGIGLASARDLKQRGWRVFASARKAEDVDSLRAEGFDSIQLDVADSDSIRRAVEELRSATGGRLMGLVNNAGYGQPGALEDLSRDAMRRQFEVNVFGLQELTNAVLPLMLPFGAGRIVHISSVVGRVALPFMGIYSASKFAVEALADAQRVELERTGIRISLVEPGPIVTRFSRNAVAATPGFLPMTDSRFAGLYAKELLTRENPERQKAFSLPPEAVARAIAHALSSPRPKRRYKVTLPAHLGAFLSRFAPDALIDAILCGELRRRKGG